MPANRVARSERTDPTRWGHVLVTAIGLAGACGSLTGAELAPPTLDSAMLAGEAAKRGRDPERAVSNFLRAASLAAAGGDRKAERTALEEAGLQALMAGRLRLAVESLERALEITASIGEIRASGRGHGLLGIALQATGRFDGALAEYREAAASYRGISSFAGEMAARMNIATIEAEWLGRPDLAAAELEPLMREARAHREVAPESVGYGLLNLAEAYGDTGRQAEGLATLLRAQELFTRFDHRPGMAFAESTRAKILLAGGEWNEARNAADRALGHAIAVRDLRPLRITRLRKATALAALGDLDSARGECREASAVLERTRRQVGLEEMQVSFLRDKLDTYETWLNVLLRASRENSGAGAVFEAVAASEASRCRTFLDHFPIPPGMSEPPGPLDVNGIRSMLESGSLLLEYFFGRDHVYRVVVSGDSVEFDVVGEAPDLASRVGFLVGMFREDAAVARERADDSAWRATADRLGRELLGPVLERHRVNESVVVVPDGPLSGLPFEVLIGAGRPVAYAPSATVLSALRTLSPPSGSFDLLAVAVPESPRASTARLAPLPLAAREVRRATRFFENGRVICLDRDASEARVREALGRGPFRMIHFAAHAEVDAEDPGNSALLLAKSARAVPGDEGDDGALTVREIAQLRIQADLVILSSCGSGTGTVTPGEGVLGLSRSFLRSGARAVVATLWDVDDAAALEMTSLLYEELASRTRLDRALVRARLRSSSPASARAFIVIGDGSLRIGECLRDPAKLRRGIAITFLATAAILGGLALWLLRRSPNPAAP